MKKSLSIPVNVSGNECPDTPFGILCVARIRA